VSPNEYRAVVRAHVRCASNITPQPQNLIEKMSLNLVIHDNQKGWGPLEEKVAQELQDVPYLPFSKLDKVGKVANWMEVEGREDTRSRLHRGRLYFFERLTFWQPKCLALGCPVHLHIIMELKTMQHFHSLLALLESQRERETEVPPRETNAPTYVCQRFD
jgi:hypothetical protein